MIRNHGRKQCSIVCGMVVLAFALMSSVSALAQSCSSDSEIDVQTYNSLIQTAGNNQQSAASGNLASLQSASMPILSNAFDSVRQSVTQFHDGLQGQMTVKHVYLLDATQLSGTPQFYCGIFGANGMTPTSASMTINGLTAGKYAMVVQTLAGTPPMTLSQIFEQQGSQWKLAGFYLKPTQVNGHDWQWFWQQAGQYKNQNKPMLAWLYYYQTWDFLAPVTFINNINLDRVSQAMSSVQSPELPTNGPVQFQSYKVTSMFPLVDKDKLDLVVKYEIADVSNTATTFQSNTAFMKAFVNAHPDVRQAFQQIVARAVTPQGQEYGTLLAIKDIQ